MKDDQQIARELQGQFPGEWVALNGDVVVHHARNAASVFREVGNNPDARLLFIDAPSEPPSLEEMTVVIADALWDHFPTRGMRVSMGETCQCGYWNGNENRRLGNPRPLPVGRDGLNIHRARIAAQALIDAGLIT